MIVVNAAASPIPSPAAPSPGLVVDEKSPYTNADSKADERRRHNRARAWSDIDHRGVVLRDINRLRVDGLNGIDRLSALLLHLNLLLLTTA